MAQHSLLSISNTTPVRLTPVGIHSGMDITIQNVNSSGYIYIGVTPSLSNLDYGFRILPNHSISFELEGKDALYAFASNSGMSAAVIKISLEYQR
jgi:hypothetical protein